MLTLYQQLFVLVQIFPFIKKVIKYNHIPDVEFYASWIKTSCLLYSIERGEKMIYNEG